MRISHLRQLTSGSTGVPKAVEISHGNLAASAIALRDGLDVDISTDVFVSWLPLSHDMGMIAFLCLSMHLGLELASSARRVSQASDRLGRVDQQAPRNRHSGPNFAYSVLARVLQRRADPSNIDLSSLRVAVNGAEPIDHRDIAEFTTVGARFGMRTTAVMPGYGLAEATLVVSLGAPHDPAVIDEVSRRAVAEVSPRAAKLWRLRAAVRHVVCVGLPVTGMEVRIRSDGQISGAQRNWRHRVRGPSVAGNYLTSAGACRWPAMTVGSTPGISDISTSMGDSTSAVARRISSCSPAGTCTPHDIERAAETVDGVRKGCVIAVRVDGDREGFAVLAEVHNADVEDVRLRISRDVTARVSRHVGHLPAPCSVVARRHALPKTAPLPASCAELRQPRAP